MTQATLSVRVPAELKRMLRKHGIAASPVVRNALEEEVRKREEMELDDRLRRAARRTKRKVKREEIVRLIRETREER